MVIKKGQHLSIDTEFKKGYKFWLGKKLSKEHIENIVKARKKNLSYNHSEEQKAMISKKLKEGYNNNKYNVWSKGLSKKNCLSLKNAAFKRRKYCGNKASNWKGGVNPINRNIRKSAMFSEWRDKIFERDNFICQNKDCPFCLNKRGVEIHPHHIKQFSKFPELRFDINNGITYCKKFHNTIHRKVN